MLDLSWALALTPSVKPIGVGLISTFASIGMLDWFELNLGLDSLCKVGLTLFPPKTKKIRKKKAEHWKPWLGHLFGGLGPRDRHWKNTSSMDE
jgi:hypothetical protein